MKIRMRAAHAYFSGRSAENHENHELLNIINFARAMYIAMRFLNLPQSVADVADFMNEVEK